MGVGGGWVGCVHIRFCRLSLKYLLIVVGDDSPERSSVQQRHLRITARKGSRALSMQKGKFMRSLLIVSTACVQMNGWISEGVLWGAGWDLHVLFTELSFSNTCSLL